MKKSVGVALAALMVAAGQGSAQNARPAQSRFFAFVGCWRADAPTDERQTLSCVVPIASSSDVELVDVVDGRVAARRRIDASGRPRAVNDDGCKGEEQASWSARPRRVYLHSEFICAPNGVAGGRTTLMAILPNGDRLDVERIRSGVGAITQVERLRDAGIPASVPSELAARLGRQRLAVMTARAEAATPLETADVVEALHHTDTAVVRAWLGATAQHFQLDGDEVASLVRADVPAAVLQAMLGTAPAYQLGVDVDASGRSTDAYLSTPGTPGGGALQMSTPSQQGAYQQVYIYDSCCTAPSTVQTPGYVPTGYSTYDGYGGTGAPYYPGVVYPAPYVSYYVPGFGQRSGFGRQDGRGGHRSQPPPPSYRSNPVGVRAGQSVAAPRAVPSRRRP